VTASRHESTNARPIRRLLVANRGEIARRIIRTASSMGISSVAVYAAGEIEAPFVSEADECVALSGRTAAGSYLDIDQLITAAERTGADAVHPGYGFLSESAAFAAAVIGAGLNWVGPPPAAIKAMGDKLEAKRLMKATGVAVLETDPDRPVFPVLVKAAAGGGGKGMRIVDRAEALEDARAAASRESEGAFGDGTVFLEPYVASARHIEVQILADTEGNVVHCFERECSIQRRHQKIIEETPSTALDGGLRDRIGEAAVAAARAVAYVSAGTVEFLLDDTGRFFFLEMNTRIQVEHPVTEAVTGLDLVREQLLIAEGAALSFGQSDLRLDGHAIEARLYAEDAANGFLPSTGRLEAFERPIAPVVRFDSGVERGSEVSIEFDPMLAKVIAHSSTRTEAALSLALALERTRIAGLVTNRDFLVAVLRSKEFLAGDTTTDFVERVAILPRRRASADVVHDAAVATALWSAQERRRRAGSRANLPSGWRNSSMPPERTRYVEVDRGRVLVEYSASRDGSFRVATSTGHADDDTPSEADARAQRVVRVIRCDRDGIELEIDGRRVAAAIACRSRTRWVAFAGSSVELTEVARFPDPDAGETVAGGLTSPMPGKVIAVFVDTGDAVDAGQLLVIVEAMKMEHRIVAPHTGVVTAVGAQAGSQVAGGDVLVVIGVSEPEGLNAGG
jgi:propionyl-CoA carboxylase alpha chain